MDMHPLPAIVQLAQAEVPPQAPIEPTPIEVDVSKYIPDTATAVTMMAGAKMVQKPKPVEVRVDHPFVFAIQHVPSGTCLFLGRVTDPR